MKIRRRASNNRHAWNVRGTSHATEPSRKAGVWPTRQGNIISRLMSMCIWVLTSWCPTFWYFKVPCGVACAFLLDNWPEMNADESDPKSNIFQQYCFDVTLALQTIMILPRRSPLSILKSNFSKPTLTPGKPILRIFVIFYRKSWFFHENFQFYLFSSTFLQHRDAKIL